MTLPNYPDRYVYIIGVVCFFGIRQLYVAIFERQECSHLFTDLPSLTLAVAVGLSGVLGLG